MGHSAWYTVIYKHKQYSNREPKNGLLISDEIYGSAHWASRDMNPLNLQYLEFFSFDKEGGFESFIKDNCYTSSLMAPKSASRVTGSLILYRSKMISIERDSGVFQ
jgi:hypothetical protein